jgi:hypothetical protein
MDSPYYSESELGGGAVMVSFFEMMQFLQHSTHFSKTCCRLSITLKFLALELPFHGWKKLRICMGWDLGCMMDVLMEFHWSIFYKLNTEFISDLASCDLWAFATMKRELWGKKFWTDQQSAAGFWEVGGALLEVHVHHLPKEVLQKRDCHHTPTKFWLRVIRWVHVANSLPTYKVSEKSLSVVNFYLYCAGSGKWFKKSHVGLIWHTCLL